MWESVDDFEWTGGAWGDAGAYLQTPDDIPFVALGDRVHPVDAEYDLKVAISGWSGQAHSTVVWLRVKAKGEELVKDVLTRAYVDARKHDGFDDAFHSWHPHNDGPSEEPSFPGFYLFYRKRSVTDVLKLTDVDQSRMLRDVDIVTGDTLVMLWTLGPWEVPHHQYDVMVGKRYFKPDATADLLVDGFVDWTFMDTFFTRMNWGGRVVTTNGYLWSGDMWDEIWHVDALEPVWEPGPVPEGGYPPGIWDPDHAPGWIDDSGSTVDTENPPSEPSDTSNSDGSDEDMPDLIEPL